MKQGLVIHLHHNILVEYCYDYEKRVEVIKRNKPLNEQAIRLKLFKILPDEALQDMPVDCHKAYADRHKADADWQKADADWQKAYADWQKADADWEKAYADWPAEEKEIFHKKWCGCNFWKNGKINFNLERSNE